MSSPRLLLLALILTALSCSGSTTPASPPRNLLIVTMDSVRADRFETPELYSELPLALAHFQAEALSFRGISSSPATLPAVASLFTGRHSRQLGYPAPDRQLPTDVATLAELFATRGYDTAAFVSSRALATGSGIERGFATFEAPDGARTEDYEVTQAAREWLSTEGCSERPWFVWVHLNAGHGPYEAMETAFNPLNFFYKAVIPSPRKLDRKLKKSNSNSGAEGLPNYQRVAGPASSGRYRTFYDARVRVGDWFANELRHSLKRSEQYDQTVFAVIGTHGEALGQHGIEFDHGHNLFDEVLRVPFLVRVPGVEASASNRLASHVDFAPTIAKLFDLELASPAGSNLLTGSVDSAPLIISELFRPVGSGAAISVRSAKWSLIQNGNSAPVAFDLGLDANQGHPLPTTDLPAVSNHLEALESLNRGSASQSLELSLKPNDRSFLRELGYVLNRFE